MSKRIYTEETITEKLKELIAKFGYFPPMSEFKRLKLTGLYQAMYRTGKSQRHYKEKLGFSVPNQWSKEKAVARLKQIFDKTKHLPTQGELRKMGEGGLAKAITNYGGFHVFAKLLGVVHKEKPKGYWKNYENIQKAIEPLVIDGRFPTSDMIVFSPNGKSIRQAIHKYHGGLKSLSKKMGYTTDYCIAPDGHYVGSGNEYLFDAFLSARGIEHQVGVKIIPDKKHTCDFKIGDFCVEIWGYEKHRKNKVCQRYNKKRKRKELMYKKAKLQLVSIESEIFRYPLSDIENHFCRLLESLGYDTSIKDITYSIENSAKGCRFWNKERITNELNDAVKAIGHFPSQDELYKIDRGDLVDAAKRHGGIIKFRKEMGHPLNKKETGYWNDETIKDELKDVIKNLKHFPVYDELKKLNRHDLIRAINRNGGFRRFQTLLGYKSKRAMRE